jgi:hypothetical protein
MPFRKRLKNIVKFKINGLANVSLFFYALEYLHYYYLRSNRSDVVLRSKIKDN